MQLGTDNQEQLSLALMRFLENIYLASFVHGHNRAGNNDLTWAVALWMPLWKNVF